MSTQQPPAAGYTFVRVQGYIFSPAAPPPPGTHAMRLWHSAGLLDFYTTLCDADEADATQLGFVAVALLGYCLPLAPSLESTLVVDLTNESAIAGDVFISHTPTSKHTCVHADINTHRIAHRHFAPHP